MNADEFNDLQVREGDITPTVITRLTTIAQRFLKLGDDGKCGPKTLEALEGFFTKRELAGFTASMGAPQRGTRMLTIDDDGWLQGDGVTRVPIHASWFGGTLLGGVPGGVVAHVSATNARTALNMANRRTHKFGTDPNDRLASWHASVEVDGGILQMIPFTKRAWHAGSNTAKLVPGLGAANARCLGFELIGWERGPFAPAQANAYAELLRVTVRRYQILRRFAMITHSSIDPKRRTDPGPVWMRDHAEAVLDRAFAA